MGLLPGVDAGPRYQVKRIVVKPGGQLSLQKHHHRAEHWVVVKGTAQVVLNDTVSTVYENELNLCADRISPSLVQSRKDPA